MTEHSPTRILRAAALLLFVPYAVTVGNGEGSLIIYNRTLHFIHVIINNDPYLYVAPGRSATFSTEDQTTVSVKAFYSPGQGIEGSAQSSFVVGGNAVVSDCNSGTNTCSTDPAFSSPTWTLTVDSLVADFPRLNREVAQ